MKLGRPQPVIAGTGTDSNGAVHTPGSCQESALTDATNGVPHELGNVKNGRSGNVTAISPLEGHVSNPFAHGPRSRSWLFAYGSPHSVTVAP